MNRGKGYKVYVVEQDEEVNQAAGFRVEVRKPGFPTHWREFFPTRAEAERQAHGLRKLYRK